MNISTTRDVELGRAIKSFLFELPDANSYSKSSIIQSIYINGEEVKLKACKNRGIAGVIWNVGIED